MWWGWRIGGEPRARRPQNRARNLAESMPVPSRAKTPFECALAHRECAARGALSAPIRGRAWPPRARGLRAADRTLPRAARRLPLTPSSMWRPQSGWSTLGRLNTLMPANSRSIASMSGVSAASIAPNTITERSCGRRRDVQVAEVGVEDPFDHRPGHDRKARDEEDAALARADRESGDLVVRVRDDLGAGRKHRHVEAVPVVLAVGVEGRAVLARDVLHPLDHEVARLRDAARAARRARPPRTGACGRRASRRCRRTRRRGRRSRTRPSGRR